MKKHVIKYLHRGASTQARFNLFIKFTKMDSDDMIGALEDHLVKGFKISEAATINGVPVSNINRSLKALEKKIKIHEDLKELELKSFK